MNETECMETDSTPMNYESSGNPVDVTSEVIKTKRRRFIYPSSVRTVKLLGIQKTIIHFYHPVKAKEFARRVLRNPGAYNIVKIKPSVEVTVPIRGDVYRWKTSSSVVVPEVVSGEQSSEESAVVTEFAVAKAVSKYVERAGSSEKSSAIESVKTEDVIDEEVIHEISALLDEGLQPQNLPSALGYTIDTSQSQAQHEVEGPQDAVQSDLQIDSVYVDNSVDKGEQSDSRGFISPSTEVSQPVSAVNTECFSTSTGNDFGQQKETALVVDSSTHCSRSPQEHPEDLNKQLSSKLAASVEHTDASSSVPIVQTVTPHFKDQVKRDLYGFFIGPTTFDSYDEYNLSRFPESIRASMAKSIVGTSQTACENCGTRLLKSKTCNCGINVMPTDKKKRPAEDLNKSTERSPVGKITKKSKMNGEGQPTNIVNVDTLKEPSNIPPDGEEILNVRKLITTEANRKDASVVKLKCTSVHFGTYIVEPCSEVIMTKHGVQFVVRLKDGSEVDIVLANNSILRCLHYNPEGIILVRTGNKWSTWIRRRFGLPKKKETADCAWFDTSSTNPKEVNLIFRFKAIPKSTLQKIQDYKLLCHEFLAVTPADAPRMFTAVGITVGTGEGNGAVWKASRASVDAQTSQSSTVKTPCSSKVGKSPRSKLSESKVTLAPSICSPNPAPTKPMTSSETPRNNSTSAFKPGVRAEDTPSGSMGQKVAIYLPEPNKEILQRGTFKLLKRDILTVCPEQLLNDTMIDFWLDHFWKNVLNEEDRQRSHIFSTFFYSRLTQKDNSTNSSQGKTEAEKRHNRVSRWTRKVDIFAKDFVIVPINEACHWYVAIICFPGLEGPEWLRDGSPITGWTNVIVSDGKASYRTAPGMPERTDDLPAVLRHRLKMKGPNVPCNPDEAGNGSDKKLAGTETSEGDSASSIQKPDVSVGKKTPLSPSKAPSNEGIGTTGNRPKLNGAFKDLNISKNDFDYEQRDEAAGDSDEDILYSKYAYEDWELLGAQPGETQEEKIKTEVKPEESHCANDFRIRQPCIIIFDSLGGESHTKVLATLREYLQEEYKLRKQKTKVFDKFTMPGLTVNCPQQQNFYDCGVYVLEYVEKLFNSPLPSYLLPLPYTVRNWFDHLDGKRKAIYDTIHALVRETKPENVGHLPAFEVPQTQTIPSSSAEIRTPNSITSRTMLSATPGSQVLLPTGKGTYKLISSSTSSGNSSPVVTKPQLQTRMKLMQTPRTPKKQGTSSMPGTPVPEAGAFETTPDLKDDKSPIGILSEGIQNTVVISAERSSVLSPPPEVQTVVNPEATDNPRDIVNIDHNYMSSSDSSSQQSTKLVKQKRGRATPTSRTPSSRRKSKASDNQEEKPSAENTPVTKPKSPASRKKKTRTPSSSRSPLPDGLHRLQNVLGTETLKIQTVEPEAEPMDVDIQ